MTRISDCDGGLETVCVLSKVCEVLWWIKKKTGPILYISDPISNVIPLCPVYKVPVNLHLHMAVLTDITLKL